MEITKQPRKVCVKEESSYFGPGNLPAKDLFIYDESGAVIAAGTKVGRNTGPCSLSCGFLGKFASPKDWANANGRVLS